MEFGYVSKFFSEEEEMAHKKNRGSWPHLRVVVWGTTNFFVDLLKILVPNFTKIEEAVVEIVMVDSYTPVKTNMFPEKGLFPLSFSKRDLEFKETAYCWVERCWWIFGLVYLIVIF